MHCINLFDPLIISEQASVNAAENLFLTTDISDKNIHEHAVNLGSKLTNHKMTKFPERSGVFLFSLKEALCFYFNVIGSLIKKSLTSSVFNKHLHWFIFLHFNPVQIISLPQAHPTLTLLSVTSLIYWVVIVIELVTSKLFWIVSCSNHFFFSFFLEFLRELAHT